MNHMTPIDTMWHHMTPTWVSHLYHMISHNLTWPLILPVPELPISEGGYHIRLLLPKPSEPSAGGGTVWSGTGMEDTATGGCFLPGQLNWCYTVSPLHLPTCVWSSLVPRPCPKIGKGAWCYLQRFPYALCQQSLFGVEKSHSSIANLTFLRALARDECNEFMM